MASTRILHLRIPRGLVDDMDGTILRTGRWADRTEFVRDACRRLVEQLESPSYSTVPVHKSERPTTTTDHQGGTSMWHEAVEEADGDEEEAKLILDEELSGL
ncbi:MAG: ribbon-helix-helix domain-containing protein [Methanopyri archaeon]|nr:ribbon-helix-helix domain-containing protein [Methanopyri archaeon]